MASIERAKTQRTGYVVRYRGPDRKPRSKTFKRRADAESFLRTVEADVIRGTWVDPNAGKILLRDWGTQWWETTVNLRPSTRARDNATYRNHIEPTFGAVPIASINHLAVRQWVAKLSASGLAPATVHKAYQVLSKILRSAVDADLLVGSPCDRVPLPRIERHEMRFLDPDGVARLANTIDPRYRALVLLGAYGGLRSGELFALRRERLDLRPVPGRRGRDCGRGRRPLPLRPTQDPRRPPIRSAAAFVVDELAAHVGEYRRRRSRVPRARGRSDSSVAVPQKNLGAGRQREPTSRHCDRTTFATPRWRCGSRRERLHMRSHDGPGTRRVRSCSTGTATCCRTPRSASRTRSTISAARAPRSARDAVVLEFPREERAKNGPEREASRSPRPAAPALNWGDASGASWNRTSDLILIRDAL